MATRPSAGSDTAGSDTAGSDTAGSDTTGPGPGSPPGGTLVERAAWIGRHARLEARLFEVLGGWVQSVPEPEVKVRLAAHSHHHAWHAQLWHDHLPLVADLDVAELAGPPDDGLGAALDVLAEPEGRGATVDRLVGFYRVVVPHLVTAYQQALEAASPVADAPLARSLRFIIADDVDEWREGEALIRALLDRPEDIERVAAHQARVERGLVAAGGLG